MIIALVPVFLVSAFGLACARHPKLQSAEFTVGSVRHLRHRTQRHKGIFANECLSSVECPSNKYCRFNVTRPSTCAPRIGPNQECRNVFGGECKEGFYCAFPEKPNPPRFLPFCFKQIPKGGKCRQDRVRPCQGNLDCRKSDNTCQDDVLGFAGDVCAFDRDCKQQSGFYCKTVIDGPFGVRKCTPKKKDGEPCDRQADNHECVGFCLRNRAPGFINLARCRRRRRAGEYCTSGRECRKIVLPGPRQDDFLCNTRTESYSVGTCVRESELITKIGARCNPQFDKCDARRNLKCHRVGSVYRCVQPSTYFGVCTPGTYLSACIITAAGAPLECRRSFGRTSKKPFSVDRCFRVREVVPFGAICNRAEYALCEKGTKCTIAPGVQNVYGRRPPPPLAFCMKEVPVGGNCADFLRKTCVKGSFCANGRCVTSGPSPTPIPVKFAGLNTNCTVLPCVPGTVCTKSPFDSKSKICSLREKVVGLWQPCFPSATFRKKCMAGTHCARGWTGRGIKRCRPLGSIFSVCEKDSGCRGRLKCAPSRLRDIFNVQRCYDPVKSLPQGAKCNPYARLSEPRCIVAKSGFPPLRCLPKGNSFACQKEAFLYDFCSSEKNIACSSRKLFCSADKNCLVRGQN